MWLVAPRILIALRQAPMLIARRGVVSSGQLAGRAA
jgi:hypothetical protein